MVAGDVEEGLGEGVDGLVVDEGDVDDGLVVGEGELGVFDLVVELGEAGGDGGAADVGA